MRIFPTRLFGPAPFVERFLFEWRHDAPRRFRNACNLQQHFYYTQQQAFLFQPTHYHPGHCFTRIGIISGVPTILYPKKGNDKNIFLFN